MTFRPQEPGIGSRAETTLRISVPEGFFERLMVAVEFRAIAQDAFTSYDPRPSSAKADSAVFLKMLLLEHILDTSSDVLCDEFISHPRLQQFLEINEQTPLPQPEEVALFRVKLGWMGFRKILNTVIQEAKRNKLSEEDCSILEKRSHSPLVVPEADLSPVPGPVAAPSNPVTASSHSPLSDPSALPRDDSQTNPLGIDHYFDTVSSVKAEAGDVPVPLDRLPVNTPVVKSPPGQTFTITSAPVRSTLCVTGNLVRLNEENARFLTPPVRPARPTLELENPDPASCFDEEPFLFVPVAQEARLEKPFPPSWGPFQDQVPEENPEAAIPRLSTTFKDPERAFTASLDFGEGVPNKAPSASMEGGEKISHNAAHWVRDQENRTTIQQRSEGPDVFPSLTALAPRKDFFTAQVTTRILHVTVPLVLVLAIYALIVFLRYNRPPTMASGPHVADAAPKSESPIPKAEPAATPPALTSDSSLRVSLPFTENPAHVLQPMPISATPDAQKPKPMKVKNDVPVESNSSIVVRPPAKLSKPAAQVSKDVSIGHRGKQALLLHLRNTYHLDLQPNQYSYEGLKDILSRLDRKAKKPDSRF